MLATAMQAPVHKEVRVDTGQLLSRGGPPGTPDVRSVYRTLGE